MSDGVPERAPELIVYWFPQGDFDTFPSRHYRLMRRIAEHVPVVGITMALDGGRAVPDVTIRRTDDPGLSVATITRSMLWARAARRVPSWSSHVIGKLLRRELARGGLPTCYTLWYSGTRVDYVPGMLSGPVVVDLIDPPFSDDSEVHLEHALARVRRPPDLYFATARTLADELERAGFRAELLPNGCDVADAAPPVADPPLRTLGFLGTLDWRFDWDLVERVAERAPDWQVVLAGRVIDEMRTRARRLEALPNVELRGPTAHDANPFETLAEFTIGMVPFRTGFVGDCINPVKMYEYAAADLPVLATPIRECRDREPLVLCRPDADAWVAALPQLVDSRRNDRAARRVFASANTWTRRAEEALAVLRARRLVTDHDVAVAGTSP
jgi:glycosyltransferase involved in cell wall biosynthesis